MNHKKIGIIGGMGPEASAYYFTQLIINTRVSKDQDHFHVIVDSNPKIPDRTAAILTNRESPVSAIQDTIARLAQVGVEEAFIPCFTSHYFFDQITANAPFKIHNVFDHCNQWLNTHSLFGKIGILATTGTCNTGLFDRYLPNHTCIYPDPIIQQEQVMAAIYDEKFGIKSGNREGECITRLQRAANHLVEQGATIIIAGCTEIGMVLKPHHCTVPLIDPMMITVLAIINFATD